MKNGVILKFRVITYMEPPLEACSLRDLIVHEQSCWHRSLNLDRQQTNNVGKSVERETSVNLLQPAE